jgi:hypothetical protein
MWRTPTPTTTVERSSSTELPPSCRIAAFGFGRQSHPSPGTGFLPDLRRSDASLTKRRSGALGRRTIGCGYGFSSP